MTNPSAKVESNKNGVEIGMMPVEVETGESGFQVCNLSEINGAMCKDLETYKRACKAASIVGTLQAGYTDVGYLTGISKKIIEREALIGVSITGWMNNPDLLFDEQVMKEGAEIVKEANKQVSKMIGINQAARTTCTKPSGNASVLLGTASGIHGEHSPRYFRNVQMNEQDEVLHLLEEINQEMVEASVWSNTGTDKVVSFPVVSPKNSIYKSDLLGVKQLEYVKKAQQNWVENGTNVELCTHPKLRHNISNTITVDNWTEVAEYIYENRQWFAGVSLLAAAGDKAYAQAPFTEVFTGKQILNKYGDAAMFASGLIVDALFAFNENLWLACDTLFGVGLTLNEESHSDLLRRDWVRRVKKYANNYFDGNREMATNCLKDCYNLHKWKTIEHSMVSIDFSKELREKKFTEVDTVAGDACAGGVCDLNF